MTELTDAQRAEKLRAAADLLEELGLYEHIPGKLREKADQLDPTKPTWPEGHPGVGEYRAVEVALRFWGGKWCSMRDGADYEPDGWKVTPDPLPGPAVPDDAIVLTRDDFAGINLFLAADTLRHSKPRLPLTAEFLESIADRFDALDGKS